VEKASECPDFKSTFDRYEEQCIKYEIFDDLFKIAAECKDIDKRVRYKGTYYREGPMPFKDYMATLEQTIIKRELERGKINKKKFNALRQHYDNNDNEASFAMAYTLYKIIEDDLPGKRTQI
jgi:hypothetical protein